LAISTPRFCLSGSIDKMRPLSVSISSFKLT
jgi:hypothetical protein